MFFHGIFQSKYDKNLWLFSKLNQIIQTINFASQKNHKLNRREQEKKYFFSNMSSSSCTRQNSSTNTYYIITHMMVITATLKLISIIHTDILYCATHNW